MKRFIRSGIIAVLAFAVIILIPQKIQAAPGAGPGTVFPVTFNGYSSTYVSTQSVFLNGLYFDVDTYHDRIIYTEPDNPGGNTIAWKVMADDLNKPHSICSDGVIYLVTDTDNHRVVTYARLLTGEFVELQSFENVGIRPHYCVYDAPTNSFYVWSSYTGEMYIYKRNAADLMITLDCVKRLDCLCGVYTRSFTIDGNNILLCSQGACGIISVDKKTFRINGCYPVSPELGGLVQITHIGNHYYLTTSSDMYGDQSKAMVARSSSLYGFMDAAYYEDVTSLLGGVKGCAVPYYITPGAGVYFARITGMRGGYSDYTVCFAEDIFGNFIPGVVLP